MPKIAYQDLYDNLVEQIDRRRLLPGMPLPSENSLAQKHKVSRPTVRKVLDMLQSKNLITVKPGVGSFVNDANYKVSQKLLTIGTNINHGKVEFYDQLIIRGMKEKIDSCRGLLTMIDKNDLRFRSDEFDGVVLISVDNTEFYEEVAANGLPIVMINRFPAHKDLSYISVDYEIEAEKAVEYMLMLGHRDIAILGSGDQNRNVAWQRTRGWERAFQRRGLTPPQDLMLSYDLIERSFDCLIDFFKNKKFTAVFVTYGIIMSTVLNISKMTGLKVPDDVSVMCFDDTEAITKLSTTPVCHVKMPLEQMGMMAVDYLIKKSQDPSLPTMKKIVEASLVINSTCRPIRSQ